MPRPHQNSEKAKDFKGAIKRLFKELKGFKKLIAVSLILAALGSILTIFTPNILSDLTDEISKGLVLNKDKLEIVSKDISNNFDKNKVMEVLGLNMTQKNIASIMINSNISDIDKKDFQEVINKFSDDSSKNMTLLSEIPDDILKELLVENEISKEDRIIFIKSLNSQIKIPESIAKAIFPEITIEEKTISSVDQAKFLELASKLNDSSNANEIYSVIDQMPDDIKSLVEPYMNIDKIKSIAIFLVCIYLISAIFNYIESISMTSVSNNFARKLRSNISTKINRLPLKYFDNHSIGDTLSRVTNDVDMIAQSMNQSLSTLVSAITLFIGTVIMMFVTNAVMAITAIIASLFGFVFMFIVLGKSQKYFSVH